MSTKLKDLIRKHRACRTAAEERALISKELALIRTSFTSQDGPKHHKLRNMEKLVYIHLLNQKSSTSFGEIECLKLMAFNSFYLKRIGYLALSVLGDNNPELTTLSTNSISLDLQANSDKSSNFILYQALGLNCVGNLQNPILCKDILPHLSCFIAKLPSAYITNKVFLCLLTTIRLDITSVEDLIDPLLSTLAQEPQETLLSLISVFLSLLQTIKSPTVKTDFMSTEEINMIKTDILTKMERSFLPTASKILRKLMNASVISQNEVKQGFLQVCLIRSLSLMVELCPKSSGTVLELLNDITHDIRDKPMKGMSNAIVYEITRIANKFTDANLNAKSLDLLSSFLVSQNAEETANQLNLRYICLKSFSQMLQSNYASYYPLINKHFEQIVECLNEQDPSIKNQAVKLIFSLSNTDNYKSIVQSVQAYLTNGSNNILSKTDTNVFRKICAHIFELTKYASDIQWSIQTLVDLIFLSLKVSSKNITTPEIISSDTFHLLTAYISSTSSSLLLKQLFDVFTSHNAWNYLTNENMQTPSKLLVFLIGDIVSSSQTFDTLPFRSNKLLEIFKELLTSDITTSLRMTSLNTIGKIYAYMDTSVQNDIQAYLSRCAQFDDLEAQIVINEYEQTLRSCNGSMLKRTEVDKLKLRKFLLSKRRSNEYGYIERFVEADVGKEVESGNLEEGLLSFEESGTQSPVAAVGSVATDLLGF